MKTVKLSKDHVGNLLEFLKRVPLKGVEVPAFNELMFIITSEDKEMKEEKKEIKIVKKVKKEDK